MVDSIEMPKRKLVDAYEARLHEELRRTHERLDALTRGRPYFNKLVAVAEQHGSSYMSVEPNLVPANDHRPRFWFTFELNSFRDADKIFTAFDEAHIALEGWREENTGEDEVKMWIYADEQLGIWLRVYLTDNSTCQKVQVGEKIVKEYVQVEKTVPVYEYICPEDDDADVTAPSVANEEQA